MPLMRLSDGGIYDVPDSDVEVARTQYGAVPADSAVDSPRAESGVNPLTEVTGAISAGINAIGGPRTLLFGGGGLAALEGARRFLTRDKSEAPPRANKGKGGKGKTTRGKAKATNPRAKVPTRPIDVEGKPGARAPAQTENPRYTGGRGASGPELARRAAMMERFQAGRPPFGPAAAGPDPELWRTRGISVPRGTVPRVAGGAANVILALLNAATIPEQMDEAERVYREFLLSQKDAATRRALQGPEGI